jgi:hypothetical protein
VSYFLLRREICGEVAGKCGEEEEKNCGEKKRGKAGKKRRGNSPQQ